MKIRIVLNDEELNGWYTDHDNAITFSEEIVAIANKTLNDTKKRFHNPDVSVVVESSRGIKLYSPENLG